MLIQCCCLLIIIIIIISNFKRNLGALKVLSIIWMLARLKVQCRGMQPEAACGVSLQKQAEGCRWHQEALVKQQQQAAEKGGQGDKNARFLSSLLPPLPHPLITVSESAFLFAFR